MPLTDAKIRNIKFGEKPIKLTDGGGLYTASGATLGASLGPCPNPSASSFNCRNKKAGWVRLSRLNLATNRGLKVSTKRHFV